LALELSTGKRDDGSLFDLRADSTDDIAATILANVSPPKVAALAKALNDGFKRRKQRPAG
jgi:hypothetical protein